MALLLAIVLGAAVLIAYSMFEKRINQGACPECGFKVWIDAPEGDCPHCKPAVDQDWEEEGLADLFLPQRGSKRVLRAWPSLVFAGVPLAIIAVAGGLLMAEHFQTETSRAIRLVKESNSRKENFTVQQYLYTSVYYRRDQGEPVSIEGWRAEPASAGAPIRVEFSYSDEDGRHVAIWEANLSDKKVAPRNENSKRYLLALKTKLRSRVTQSRRRQANRAEPADVAGRAPRRDLWHAAC